MVSRIGVEGRESPRPSLEKPELPSLEGFSGLQNVVEQTKSIANSILGDPQGVSTHCQRSDRVKSSEKFPPKEFFSFLEKCLDSYKKQSFKIPFWRYAESRIPPKYRGIYNAGQLEQKLADVWRCYSKKTTVARANELSEKIVSLSAESSSPLTLPPFPLPLTPPPFCFSTSYVGLPNVPEWSFAGDFVNYSEAHGLISCSTAAISPDSSAKMSVVKKKVHKIKPTAYSALHNSSLLTPLPSFSGFPSSIFSAQEFLSLFEKIVQSYLESSREMPLCLYIESQLPESYLKHYNMWRPDDWLKDLGRIGNEEISTRAKALVSHISKIEGLVRRDAHK